MVDFASVEKFHKMTIDFYHLPGSAPCTSVRLLAGALGIDLNLKFTDLMQGEHLTPEFLKVIASKLTSNAVYDS